MAVVVTAPYVTATGNGATTSFPFELAVRNVADVAVYVNGTLQTVGFSVTLNTDFNGGTVLFTTAPANAAAILIAVQPSLAQQIKFVNSGPYNPSTVDGANDAAAIRDIFLQGQISRAPLVPIGETMGPIPAKASRAGLFFGFDAGGNPVALNPGGADSALRTDLAAPSGAALVGNIRSSPSAISRTIASIINAGPPTPEDFAAVGDGTADDTAAILAARNAAGAGGTVMGSPGKTYKITSTIALSANDAKLIGPGAGDIHDTGTPIVAPCRLLWGGASGGTMVQVKSAGTQYIAGNEFRGIFLDGNSGLAAIGLNLVGNRLGTFEVVGAHFTTALLKMDPDTALSEPQGCSENLITRLTGYQTNVGDGCLLLETSTSTNNCSQNLFQLISGDFRNGFAIDLQGSDSETFEVIKLFATLAAATGLRLKGGASLLQAARNNLVRYLASTTSTAPVAATGTETGDAFPSVQNNISFLDTANNPNLPTVGTGASLWWGTIKAPLGLRSYSPVVLGSSSRQDASGLIIQSGVTGSVAASGSTSITLPTPLPSGAISVQVTPRTAGMAFHADCSATTLVIHNDGASPTDFFWRVEGV